MILAPIALFAFNRLAHLSHTLDALAKNDLARNSALTIFCDGPRNEAEREKTNAVTARAYEEVSKSRFSSVRVFTQEKNQGLSSSIITGISRMLEENDRVIVLEDDIVTSPYFLQYMNNGLQLYEKHTNVSCIHGWCFPHNIPHPPASFFLRGADIWGWATWRHSWKNFRCDAIQLLHEIDSRGLKNLFNVDDTYDYYDLLTAHKDGKVSSWDVCWLASAFLAEMYVLYPGRSLVHNIGNDSSGTHCGTSSFLDTELTTTPVPMVRIPVCQHKIMYAAYRVFCLRASGGRWARFKRRIKRFLRKCCRST